MVRDNSRSPKDIRSVGFDMGCSPYAEGSCLTKMGKTQVLCTVTVEEQVPHFLRGTGQGWVTAEYAMLPRATHQRTPRESRRVGPSGRTMEIQRLIGRSLRSAIDLYAIPELQCRVDCDVLQADGGTRTTAINGAYMALNQAFSLLKKKGLIKTNPFKHRLVAISCGIVQDSLLLDLDYHEDSRAQVDANFVMTSQQELIEVQMTAESYPLKNEQMARLQDLAFSSIDRIIQAQDKVVSLL